MRRSTAVVVVTLAAALPRLAVLAHERGTILTAFVDKSDRFATTLVYHGTFGFLPGVPSAYTQPLYGWFLAGIYWPFGRSWLAVGLAFYFSYGRQHSTVSLTPRPVPLS